MKVTTPVKGFTGEVAGVAFVDGVGETENVSALAYFRRQGYGIATEEDPADAKPAEQNKETDDEGEKSAAKAAPRRGRQSASK